MCKICDFICCFYKVHLSLSRCLRCSMALLHELSLTTTSTTLLALAAATLFLYAIFSFFQLEHHSTSRLPLPPVSPGLPFVGETLDLLRAMRDNKVAEFAQARFARYGPVFTTSLFFSPTVMIHGAEANRFLFSNDSKRLTKHSIPTSVFKLCGGDNIFTNGSVVDHIRLRRVIIDSLFPEGFVAKVEMLTQQHFVQHWLGRERVSLNQLAKVHTMNISNIILLGIEDKEWGEKLAKLFSVFNAGLISLPVYFPGTAYYKAHQARLGLLKVLEEVMSRKKMRMVEGQSTELKDLFSGFIAAKDENDKPLTQKEVLDLTIGVLVASFESLSSTISMACKFLSDNPACCEVVLKEQMAISESKKQGEFLTTNDLLKMKCTWGLIQETMRVQPAAFALFREAVKDIEYGGVRIPRGWKIMLSIAASHSDERYFPDPKTFDPSRFVEGTPPPNAFIPFGGGPHMCVGKDYAKVVVLVFLHHLIRRFEWTPVDPKEQISINLTPSPRNGFPIRIEERKL